MLDNGHSFVQVLKRSGILQRIVHKELGNTKEEILLKFAESGHPIFCATTPLSRGSLKNKGRGKLLIHFSADTQQMKLFFRTIISANQPSVHGAVANICEEFQFHQDRPSEPDEIDGSIKCSR